MKHLSEEEMVLYYYREAGAPPEAESHLSDCAECREVFAALERALSLAGGPAVPERGENYGAEVWRRIAPRLEERKGLDWLAWLRPQRLAWAGAMAALLMVAFFLGRFWPDPPGRVAGVEPLPAQVQERILVVAVGEHLERSQMLLVELVNAPEKTGLNITADQRRAEDLVSANRLYRQTAARAGETGVAGVLDELERVLVEIANGPSELTAGQLERLRKRIESRGILFKVRVIESQMRAREKQARKEVAGLT